MISLHLYNVTFSGSELAHVGGLKALKTLDLSNNRLEGTNIPSANKDGRN
jgi:hypothetical protein